ncbi:MAG: phosphoribosylanthranilate isomerase [Bacteroidales bacterium]|nr:phosphoribosylanthranilate isomerase [Bacteroidales bacterium]
MKVKVCGLREPENIAALAQLPLDWMGFIFYEASPRYAGGLLPAALRVVPSRIKRVGVFVDSPFGEILQISGAYGLDTVQLHGKETPGMCRQLQSEGLEVIKAFSIASREDTGIVELYGKCCDYYLFDTKTLLFGGSGKSFDWSVLETYNGDIPFLLSGGIGEEDAEKVASFMHSMMAGIDLNSRFELMPGIKDVEKIKRFVSNKAIQKNDKDE